MKKRLGVCALGLVFIFSVPVQAEPIIEVGRVELLYGLADQEVQFFVTGGDPVDRLFFYIQVADGGPELGDSGMRSMPGPGTPGPHITNVDLITGTIFENNYVNLKPGLAFQQYRHLEIFARSGTTVPAGDPNGLDPRLVATVTFDTSMWGAEYIDTEWELRLRNVVDAGDGGYNTVFGDAGGMSTAGSIVIVVPEPSTAALLTLGVALLLLRSPTRRRFR